MRYLLAVTLALGLCAQPAAAELRLSQLVGSWAGVGSYTEGVTTARMRCRMTISGNDELVSLNGRCGSSLGARRLVLDFRRGPDGTVTMRPGKGAPPSDSEVDGLQGTLADHELVLSGAAGHESVTMLLRLAPNGVLHFASDRKWQTGRGRSAVDLLRR